MEQPHGKPLPTLHEAEVNLRSLFGGRAVLRALLGLPDPEVDNQDVLHGTDASPLRRGHCLSVVSPLQRGQSQKDDLVDGQSGAAARTPKKYCGQRYPKVSSPILYPSLTTLKQPAERETISRSEQTSSEPEDTFCLSPETFYQDRTTILDGLSPSSLPEGLPNSWDFIEETTGNRTVRSIDAAESAGPCLNPLLSEEQCLPSLHGNFKSGRPWKEQIDPQWVRVKTIMDSGAASSIAHPSMPPGVRIEESDMSRKGQSFITAGDGRIPNQGQQSLRVVTNEGKQGKTCYQMGDVNRPLTSITQTV